MGILVYSKQQNNQDLFYSVLGKKATFVCTLDEAKERMSRMNVEIVFIDLTCMDEDGMRLARYIRSIHRYYLTPIVFTADNDLYERQAFREIRCYEYMYNPVSPTRLQEIINLLCEKLDPLYIPKSLVVKMKEEIYRIQIEDVLYVEILNKHLVIHTQYGILEFPYHPIRECVLQARGDLIQCHRAMAVNRQFVKKVDYGKRRIELDGYPDLVLLGPKYAKDLHALFDAGE